MHIYSLYVKENVFYIKKGIKPPFLSLPIYSCVSLPFLDSLKLISFVTDYLLYMSWPVVFAVTWRQLTFKKNLIKSFDLQIQILKCEISYDFDKNYPLGF